MESLGELARRLVRRLDARVAGDEVKATGCLERPVKIRVRLAPGLRRGAGYCPARLPIPANDWRPRSLFKREVPLPEAVDW